MSKILANKGPGFYISGTAAVLSFLLAIYYQISYSSNPYYSSKVVVALMVALPVAVILLLIRAEGFMPAAVTACIGAGLLFFIYAMYFDISVVLVGIDKSSFDPEFIITSAVGVICFLLGEISIYTKVRR